MLSSEGKFVMKYQMFVDSHSRGLSDQPKSGPQKMLLAWKAAGNSLINPRLVIATLRKKPHAVYLNQ